VWIGLEDTMWFQTCRLCARPSISSAVGREYLSRLNVSQNEHFADFSPVFRGIRRKYNITRNWNRLQLAPVEAQYKRRWLIVQQLSRYTVNMSIYVRADTRALVSWEGVQCVARLAVADWRARKWHTDVRDNNTSKQAATMRSLRAICI